MDAVEIYTKLPEDCRSCIRTYFTVWQRYGFATKPPVLRRALPSAYYSMVRHVPGHIRYSRHALKLGISMNFYYRRQRDRFQWRLTLKYADDSEDTDEWWICMSPRWQHPWKNPTKFRTIVSDLLATRFYTTVPLPHHVTLLDVFVVDEDGLLIVFDGRRPSATSPPTTQACLVAMTDYIKALANVIH
jgi:hypothetical protein